MNKSTKNTQAKAPSHLHENNPQKKGKNMKKYLFKATQRLQQLEPGQSSHSSTRPSYQQQSPAAPNSNAKLLKKQIINGPQKTFPSDQQQHCSFYFERIFGHGVDIAYIPRFVDMINRWGAKFYSKALHPKEILHVESLANIEEKSRYLASRWAIKEAVVKASAKRILFYEVYMERDPARTGDPRPSLVLEGDTKDYFERLGLNAVVSISHDKDYSIGSAIIYQRFTENGVDLSYNKDKNSVAKDNV